ncbi:MAG TPA: methionyl-tRNA formyltransferase [Ktedonobacterales bacterium]
MRVVFMGTPHFAVPTLQNLVTSAPPGHIWSSGLDLAGVITRPDKPAGRSGTPQAAPVKLYAQEVGLPVYQPGSFRRPEALALLHRLAPDLIVVAAFGQILPTEVIELPEHGCLNVHASLLPRHRGASPIAASILAGDAETGVTIMLMDEGLDTGPIIAQTATPIGVEETAGELTTRLAEVGAHALIEVLPRWLAGGIEPTPQDSARATTTRLLRKTDGQLDWTQPAERLSRQIRAYTPWPGAFTTWRGRQLKVLHAHVADATNPQPDGEPGTIFLAPDERGEQRLACVCGQGAITLEMIQLEGKRALPGSEFLRGNSAIVGARLGQ